MRTSDRNVAGAPPQSATPHGPTCATMWKEPGEHEAQGTAFQVARWSAKGCRLTRPVDEEQLVLWAARVDEHCPEVWLTYAQVREGDVA